MRGGERRLDPGKLQGSHSQHWSISWWLPYSELLWFSSVLRSPQKRKAGPTLCQTEKCPKRPRVTERIKLHSSRYSNIRTILELRAAAAPAAPAHGRQRWEGHRPTIVRLFLTNSTNGLQRWPVVKNTGRSCRRLGFNSDTHRASHNLR